MMALTIDLLQVINSLLKYGGETNRNSGANNDVVVLQCGSDNLLGHVGAQERRSIVLHLQQN